MGSSCCWAKVIDHGNTWEWLCSECYEHSNEESDEKENADKKVKKQIDGQIEFYKELFTTF